MRNSLIRIFVAIAVASVIAIFKEQINTQNDVPKEVQASSAVKAP